jgi:ketosteroid isomerase-like protein
MAHPNEQLLRKLDQADESGDIDNYFSDFTEDASLHIGGRSKLSGDYRGHDQLKDALTRFLGAVGDRSFSNHAYLADDDHGLVLQHSTFTRDGRTLELDEAFVFHFRDGKASEFWYQPVDQAAFDAWVG